jgi:hypothetical protein
MHGDVALLKGCDGEKFGAHGHRAGVDVSRCDDGDCLAFALGDVDGWRADGCLFGVAGCECGAEL